MTEEQFKQKKYLSY